MKKINTLLIAVALMLSLCVTAFATGDFEVAVPKGEIVDDGELFSAPEAEMPGVYDEYDEYRSFEDEFGASGIVGVLIIVFAIVFFPLSLVLVIVFAVLNSKAKKSISNYERAYGAGFGGGYNPANAQYNNYAPTDNQGYYNRQGGQM